MCKMFLPFSPDVCVIFCYWNISMKCTYFIFICHLLMLTYFLCGKYSTISILLLIIYWCWLFFMCKMFLSFSTDVYVIFLYWNILMKWMHFIFICHWHIFCVENILQFQYCFWLFTDVDYFFMCKMFLSFSTDVYVIFCYWNISMKCTHFIFICHLLMLTYFLCGKYSTISILLLIIYWCWLFFHVQNVLIILNWCLCDFLLLKHIDEVSTHFIFICHLLMLTYFLCGKYSTILILLLIIYWCWLFFMCKMFLPFSTDVYVIFCYWNILMKWIHFIFICHWHIFCVENILQFQYCFWLFTDVDYFFKCKMFLSFSTDVYVIFLYWNILMKCTHFIFICHLLMLTYFLCGKYSTISILLLIIYWCWLFFHVQNVLTILTWCLCDFLLLKHIDEVITFHLHLSFTDVDIFFVWKIFYNFNTAFDNLLMLTIFYVQNVLTILNWCLCDFLVLKHIDEVDTLHLHLSLTYFLCGKYSTISILLLIIYWCWLFFHVQNVLIILNWCLCDFLLLKHIDEVHAFHLHLSFTDVDIFFVWKIFYNFNTAFDYLLMLTIFSCAKCSYHSHLMFVWFSVTETYRWSAHISSSFVIYWCWHIFCVENILQFQYCFW